VCPRIGGSRNRASSRWAHPKSQMRTVVISSRSVSPPVSVSGARGCGDAADGQVWRQGESCGVGCMNLAESIFRVAVDRLLVFD
jgi:hypothetical protein